MLNNEDFYYEYTRKRDIHLVEDVARYLCDRFPLNYSHLVLELCKMYLNQKYDCKFQIDPEIAKLPFLIAMEGG